MKLKHLVLFSLLLTGCASGSWPKPEAPHIHAVALSQVYKQRSEWLKTPGNSVQHASLTGSMRPYIMGGAKEFLFLEKYNGQPLKTGMVVIFSRDAGAVRCLHLIAGVRGEYLYLTGINNRHSDGWFHKSTVCDVLNSIWSLN